MGQGIGLREQKKQATRRALHEAAVRLMTASSPQTVTVEAICAAAGVSPRTFFNYFDSKEEALFPAHDEYVPAITATIRDHPAGTPLFEAAGYAIRDLFERTMSSEDWASRQDLIQAHPELMAVALRLGEELERAIADGIAARTGHAVDDIFVQTVAAAVSAGVRVISRNWTADPTADLDGLVDQVFGILKTGAAVG